MPGPRSGSLRKVSVAWVPRPRELGERSYSYPLMGRVRKSHWVRELQGRGTTRVPKPWVPGPRSGLLRKMSVVRVAKPRELDDRSLVEGAGAGVTG